MKLGDNTKAILKQFSAVISLIGALITIAIAIATYSGKVASFISNILAWFFPAVLLKQSMFELLIPIMSWLVFILLFSLTYMAMGQILRRFTQKFVGNLLRDLDEELNKKIYEALNTQIEQEMKEMQPPLPPYGVTGQPCPRSGLYRVQDDDWKHITSTFTEGEIFPAISNSHREVRVTWIYEPPQHSND